MPQSAPLFVAVAIFPLWCVEYPEQKRTIDVHANTEEEALGLAESIINSFDKIVPVPAADSVLGALVALDETTATVSDVILAVKNALTVSGAVIVDPSP